MREELVSFQTAKLAKEKGFDEYCTDSYLNSSKETYSHLSQGIVSIKKHGYLKRKSLSRKNSDMANAIDERFSAPTQSLLQKWIREVHKINVESNYLPNIQKYSCLYIPMTGKASIKDNIYVSKIRFNTYEEALEEGLYQALNLIK